MRNMVTIDSFMETPNQYRDHLGMPIGTITKTTCPKSGRLLRGVIINHPIARECLPGDKIDVIVNGKQVECNITYVNGNHARMHPVKGTRILDGLDQYDLDQ